MRLDSSSRFDEYGIIAHDGGASKHLDRLLPLVRHQVPASKRNRWFDELGSTRGSIQLKEACSQ